jgi:hypothetical protein
MAIDLSEDGQGYSDLKEHVGHRIVCVPYGDDDDPVNVAIECETCNCVLVDFDKPDTPKRRQRKL